MMEWINIKDQKPPKDTWVISFGDLYDDTNLTNTRIAVTKYTEESHWQGFEMLSSGCGCCDGVHENVTHWMPLPKIPDIET